MDYKEKVRLAKETLESGSYDKETIYYIFPELKESEDELTWLKRFIKEEIDCLRYDIRDYEDRTKLENLQRSLSWLEKQGEQKLYVNDNAKEMFIKALERVEEQNNKGYKLTDCDKNSWWEDFKAYTYCTIEQKPVIEIKTPEESLGIDSDTYNKIVDECIYGEQKPAELPKGEDYGIDGLYAAIDILETTLGKVNGYQSDDGILEHKCAISAVKKLYEQKPANETPYPETLEKAIDLYYNSYGNGEGEFEHLSLEKFRDIVHTFVSDYGQKPAGWSEEDKKAFRNLCSTLSNLSTRKLIEKETEQKYVGWLKSLRPQNRWKPSDAQIIELRRVISGCSYDIEPLVEIEEQLKKLMEK